MCHLKLNRKCVCMCMYCVFCYDNERWVSGIRRNAITYANNKLDALKIPDLTVAYNFVVLLETLYPYLYFRVFPFNE